MPRSFPPVVGRSPKVLVLGSMPGVASLKAGRYYAHPHNQFWRLLGAALGEDLASLPYPRRLARLKARGVALWDVLKECRREGSLDSNIKEEKPNAVATLVKKTRLVLILLNGGKAAQAFRRFIAASLPGVRARALPSSSPAAAAIPFARKKRLWKAALLLGLS